MFQVFSGSMWHMATMLGSSALGLSQLGGMQPVQIPQAPHTESLAVLTFQRRKTDINRCGMTMMARKGKLSTEEGVRVRVASQQCDI